MTRVQELLDQEARLGNQGLSNKHPLRVIVHEEIKNLRGQYAPVCWGEDDCSTTMLMTCPWRIDCDHSM
jgi:hypothetical protein